MKKTVAILFGGKSAEHEVSVKSAESVSNFLEKDKYNQILIGISKTGKWNLLDDSFFSENNYVTQGEELSIALGDDGKIVKTLDSSEIRVDVFFPVLHGPFGEDGTLQGVLKSMNVAFVGGGVLGSAVGMDKDVMKRLLREAGIPVGKFVVKTADDYIDFEKVVEELGLPIFVKPANLGSSVGINKVKNKDQFEFALKEAFEYDSKIIIEEFIKGREIECSVLGNENPTASVPGEISYGDEFYSYETKYSCKTEVKMEIPAHIPEEISKKIQEMSIKVFQILCCEGLGRVDFFLTEKGKIFVNEINTIPGFTQFSMYPKLWEASGVNYGELLDKLIEFALARFEKESRLKTSYLS